MTNCRQFEDLLAIAKELSHAESESLDRHLGECESCRSKMSQYRTIMAALETSGSANHPAPALLSRFAVQRCEPGEPDYDGSELSAAELEGIESHLERCDDCRRTANAAISEFRELDAYLEGQGLPETLPPVAETRIFEQISELFRRIRGVGILATASSMAVVLLWASPLFRADAERWYALTSLDGGGAVVTRSDAGTLGTGVAAFAEGRYQDAIRTLELYTRDAGPEAAPYGRYVLGLAYLHSAKRDVLGRMHRVDVERIDRGLLALVEAERATDLDRVREDAAWFQAQGHLLKLDTDAALGSLERVIAMDGRRAGRARALAEEIRVLSSSR